MTIVRIYKLYLLTYLLIEKYYPDACSTTETNTNPNPKWLILPVVLRSH